MMEYAHTGLKPVNWVQPATVKTASAFIVRNHIHYGDIEPSPSTDLYPGWYIGGGSVKNTSQTIDKVSGLVATTCTPALAKEYAYNSNAASWNIDIFRGGQQSIGSTSVGTSTTDTDNIHNCNDSPPTASITATDSSGQQGSCTTSCTITVTATQGTHPLSGGSYTTSPAGTIEVKLNGQTINSTSIPSGSSNVYSYSFTYTPTSNGSAALTATVDDSVLYQGTTSSTLNYSVPPPPQQPTFLQPTPGHHHKSNRFGLSTLLNLFREIGSGLTVRL
ncbi:MAG TPA: hypothetical protein VMU97_00280, partial [Candidatus Dormibacteraeota bacterium]|nr:hypothetical protein [Candidatus Dormibacteraeota bacterium]